MNVYGAGWVGVQNLQYVHVYTCPIQSVLCMCTVNVWFKGWQNGDWLCNLCLPTSLSTSATFKQGRLPLPPPPPCLSSPLQMPLTMT